MLRSSGTTFAGSKMSRVVQDFLHARFVDFSTSHEHPQTFAQSMAQIRHAHLLWTSGNDLFDKEGGSCVYPKGWDPYNNAFIIFRVPETTSIDQAWRC